MKRLIVIVVAIVLMGGVSIYANAINSEGEKETEKDISSSLLDTILPSDIIIGDEKAPVTIIEYASLSCSHCKHFHEDILPSIKERYIDQGKAKLIYRHFPLNGPALRAAMLVSCVKEDRQVAFLDALFGSQKEWAYTRDFEEKLKKIARIGGLDALAFETCMLNKVLEEDILALHLKTSKELNIESTPTVFVDGEKIVSKDMVNAMVRAIEAGLETSEVTTEESESE